MVNPNRFYTYAYLRKDGTPYYIGKGTGKRAYQKHNLFNPPPKERIIFLKQNLTEEEAFKHEIYMIAVFGRKDLRTGILRNKTDGGDGSSGFVHSEESKRKMSEKGKGKFSGKNNPMYGVSLKGENHHFYGKSHTKETKIKMSEKRKGKKPYDMTDESRRKMSEAKKNKPLSKEHIENMSKARRGRKWWNNGKGNTKFVRECPGEGWALGRRKKPKQKLVIFDVNVFDSE